MKGGRWRGAMAPTSPADSQTETTCLSAMARRRGLGCVASSSRRPSVASVRPFPSFWAALVASDSDRIRFRVQSAHGATRQRRLVRPVTTRCADRIRVGRCSLCLSRGSACGQTPSRLKTKLGERCKCALRLFEFGPSLEPHQLPAARRHRQPQTHSGSQ